MADLVLDLNELKQLATDLASIQQELENADGNAADAAEATGHDGLCGKVNDFADKWRIKREDMLKDVTTLASQITMIADNFGQVDADLAKALEKEATR